MNFDFGVEGFFDVVAEGPERWIFGRRDAELAELHRGAHDEFVAVTFIAKDGNSERSVQSG